MTTNKCLLSVSARELKRVLLVCLLLCSTGIASLANAANTLLKDTAFVKLPGNKLEVRLDFDHAPGDPRVYAIDSPPRLVLDFFGVENDIGSKSVAIKNDYIDTLNFAQSADRLRVVANLFLATPYETYAQDNSLFIVFGGGESVASKNASVPVQPQPVAEAKPVVSAPVTKVAKAPALAKAQTVKQAYDDNTRVKGIDFERVAGGIGRVTIALSDDKAGIDIEEEGNNVAVTLTSALLSPGLQQRVNVQDFATPVMFIDSVSQGGNTTILIKPEATPYDYMAYQTGSQLVLDFKHLTRSEEDEEAENEFPYKGEKIDLNFQNVSVRSVLQILAEVAQLNLVVDDEVTGQITLRLKHVPWDQALDIVLKTRGLDKRQVGNVLLVAPAEQIAERERIELASQQSEKELSPLRTDFIQVDFRKASEMKSRIEAAQLISERGLIIADNETNILMVRETAAQLEQIRKTIKKFDAEVEQIMVEARLVTASTDFTKELGVRWGFGLQSDRWVAGGGGSSSPYYAEDFPAIGVNTPLNVDLGVKEATSTFRIGYASSDFLISAELSALQNEGSAEVVSQPKVITTNGKAARIESGTELPYQTVENGEVKIEFKEVVLRLDVIPQINPGDRIALDLKITQDSVGQALDSGEFAIDTNELVTSVVVKDGDTIVLGGVYKNKQVDGTLKTPVLGDLPGIGRLFRKETKIDEKVELLIFITPKIIRESLSASR